MLWSRSLSSISYSSEPEKKRGSSQGRHEKRRRRRHTPPPTLAALKGSGRCSALLRFPGLPCGRPWFLASCSPSDSPPPFSRPLSRPRRLCLASPGSSVVSFRTRLDGGDDEDPALSSPLASLPSSRALRIVAWAGPSRRASACWLHGGGARNEREIEGVGSKKCDVHACLNRHTSNNPSSLHGGCPRLCCREVLGCLLLGWIRTGIGCGSMREGYKSTLPRIIVSPQPSLFELESDSNGAGCSFGSVGLSA